MSGDVTRLDPTPQHQGGPRREKAGGNGDGHRSQQASMPTLQDPRLVQFDYDTFSFIHFKARLQMFKALYDCDIHVGNLTVVGEG